MVERDLLVAENGLMIIRNGTFATGPSLTQEVALIMLTNKGEIRNDIFCGCDLLRRKDTLIRRSEFERIVKVQLERDGKTWTDLKNGIKVRANA